ncbi:MAG TPA: acyl carrier protein [Paludibacteraceae bacterium]|nr:acyl carrier protein [Paludibacteraceae bacterium]HQF50471.1 acyl carrier protein [Paludibacteraceae bacterium]HQJ89387.1 acyl carrier protein [Paludibacteraceae bacterium]
MDLKDFISNFAAQFPDEDSSSITADTDFHELDTWSSLNSLLVVTMVFQEYGVELESQDVRDADTIEDLYNIVKNRKA